MSHMHAAGSPKLRMLACIRAAAAAAGAAGCSAQPCSTSNYCPVFPQEHLGAICTTTVGRLCTRLLAVGLH